MKSKRSIKFIIVGAVIVFTLIFFIKSSVEATTASVIVETANLRKTADTNATILEQISIGEIVEVLEQEGDWYKVEFENIIGYLRNDLISLNGELESEDVQDDTQETTKEDTNIETEEEVQDTDAQVEEPQSIIYIVKSDCNLKIIPSINATDIIEVKQEEQVVITETINDWACIEVGVTKGFIRIEMLEAIGDTTTSEVTNQENEEVVEETNNNPTIIATKYINVSSANLRKEASTSAEVVSGLTINNEVSVYEETTDGWSRIKVVVTEEEGYVSSSLLSDTMQDTTSRSTTEIRTQTTSDEETVIEQTEIIEENIVEESSNQIVTTTAGSSIVGIAMNYIGYSYVYGGTTPTSGFDCSGFTQYVYNQYGISISRTSSGQYSNGVYVSKEDLQLGDLIMFGSSSINHVGIYIGNGRIVHAANASRGVTTDTIESGYYYTNYIGARRII